MIIFKEEGKRTVEKQASTEGMTLSLFYFLFKKTSPFIKRQGIPGRWKPLKILVLEKLQEYVFQLCSKTKGEHF